MSQIETIPMRQRRKHKIMEIKEILEKIQNHEISIEEAEKQIKHNQYEDLGYGAGYLANKINHLAV